MKIDLAKIGSLEPGIHNVSIPGSKSYTLRALFIAALCDARPKISGSLESNDTTTMKSSLDDLQSGKAKLFTQDSGITTRFMLALACISNGQQTISGNKRLNSRPIADLVNALRGLGAKIEYIENKGFPPVRVISNSLTANKVKISGSTSSQFLSALLLIGPTLEEGLDIYIDGKQISKPYVDITIDIMDKFGVNVDNKNYQHYSVKPQKYNSEEYKVEGDYSSASYFYAISILTGNKIKIENLNADSLQGDKKFVDLINGFNGKIKPMSVNAEDFPDQAMTLAVLLAHANGKSVITGVKSLRVKESERVKATQNELAKMGVKTESTEDSLTIHGGSPKPAQVATYNDHRIAMSFAVASTKTLGIDIVSPKVVNKTFPGFWDELNKIAEVKIIKKDYSNILLIGMRGTGKTTIGRTLAQKLNMEFVDIDKQIESSENQRVRDIVDEHGWAYYRKLESEKVREVSGFKNTVISSGGGMIMDPKNMKNFADNSLKILLVAEPDLLIERIKHDKNRYKLTAQPTLLGELAQVWDERKKTYFANADFVIDSLNSPMEVAEEIKGVLTQ